MSGKILSLCSWSLTIFLLCLFGHIHISDSSAICQYYKNGQAWPLYKQCPYICCPFNRQTTVNTTCCNPVIPITKSSSYCAFGYNWWIIFVCIFCILTALCILIHYCKRIPIPKKWKHSNSMVKPSSVVTISKEKCDINSVCYYTNEDNTIIAEQNAPPKYTNVAIISPSPPPYASVDSSTTKYLE